MGDPEIAEAQGAFVTLAGERHYAIRNVDAMPPFLVNLVSDGDLWMFVASNGGLTAGRVSPDTALFPYVTVDKIYDSITHTGCKTIIRVQRDGQDRYWEPFNYEHDGRYAIQRNLYKNLLGDKLLFEEINADLQLAFRYRWATSSAFGFVREVSLENHAARARQIEIVDGLQNLLPAGTPRFSQANASYLVDAYKWSELDARTGLASFTLFSGITDRAEPCESLRATTVFCTGLDHPRVLLTGEQLARFRRGGKPERETHRRGVRGAYFVYAALELAAESREQWQLVADVEQSQAETVATRQRLLEPQAMAADIGRSVRAGSDALARIVAAADGFQTAGEEHVTAHHYANTLFNVLRGGIVADQYCVSTAHLGAHIRHFNREVHARCAAALDALPPEMDFATASKTLAERGDRQLDRLVMEYLPITFGRRHGDPSRPWNDFAIRLAGEHGEPLLTYQGNWRDIFQNWEALLLGYPGFIDNIIAKFVNASTADGYNPYRITDAGIDWEVEDPEDPWSYIGYWGDHQIIYLLKLLELSRQFHPRRLAGLLDAPLFSYANVPYRIKPFDSLLEDARNTVEFNTELATRIDERVAAIGADGRLLPAPDGGVCQVTLLEKLLVPLLAKLGNLVVDGGIWLNTQRPEWNDANNALVGNGLSMVTLYYLRRYVVFLRELLATQADEVALSGEVARWLAETAAPLRAARPQLGAGRLPGRRRYELLAALGRAASRHREALYTQGTLSGAVQVSRSALDELLDDALAAIDHSLRSNRRPDGLYQAYNLLDLQADAIEIDTLYPMLEGQVAALSSGAIAPAQAVEMLEALFASPLYRPDQHSFMLYPDRELPRFLEKNRIAPGTARCAALESVELVQRMIERGDRRIVQRDADGNWRFDAALVNASALSARLDELAAGYDAAVVAAARAPLAALYEEVFGHRAFTGRSGGMFGFEGLGSVYWHMVAKLLLAVQETFFAARDGDAAAETCKRLAEFYYRIRNGLGFNKTPADYGAFPTDPYSHTPGHAGAQQPGMTGQVKEELLTRFGELGLRVREGAVHIDPALLRAREFLDKPAPLRYLDVAGDWQVLPVPERALAFTWCQVPFVYRLGADAGTGLVVHRVGGERELHPGPGLPPASAAELFARSHRIAQVELTVAGAQLHGQ